MDYALKPNSPHWTAWLTGWCSGTRSPASSLDLTSSPHRPRACTARSRVMRCSMVSRLRARLDCCCANHTLAAVGLTKRCGAGCLQPETDSAPHCCPSDTPASLPGMRHEERLDELGSKPRPQPCKGVLDLCTIHLPLITTHWAHVMCSPHLASTAQPQPQPQPSNGEPSDTRVRLHQLQVAGLESSSQML